MRNRFDEQLEKLNYAMIEMGSLIESAIEMAITALEKQDVKQAQKTIAFDEEIDQKEKEIENLCLKLLLQQQPVAKDLRVVSSALKMITDMERIGDHASDISEITLLLADKQYIYKLAHLHGMATETTQMVIQSLEAYVNKDLKLANEVIQRDDTVDALFLKVKSELIQLINQDATYGEQAADLLMIAKYFERIGDHATNIAEWVIFSITGIHEDMN